MLVAFDPSARDAGSSALLVREDDLQCFLNDTGSALVWAMTGEKRANGPGPLGGAWAGALQLSGGWRVRARKIRHVASRPDARCRATPRSNRLANR